MTSFAAVLWDMDGTIVDTEPLWMAGEHALAAQYGRTWTHEDALSVVGSALETAAEYIRTRLDLPLTPPQIVEFLIERVAAGLAQDIQWRPGAAELIKALDADGVPQALVTMSYARLTEPVVAQLPFGAVVSGDSVVHGKPHPEPYLRAAELLGVDPRDCLAIEDSPTGAASATAAGCRVLAVPHVVDVPPADRRTLVATLAGLTPEDLARLFD